MPSVTGRVCYHPCETACNRAAHDEPIGIRSVERFLGDYGLALPEDPIAGDPAALNGTTVAIVGSGPAGLACAYHLRRRGYSSVIFEALDKPGGMLRAGIPHWHLPEEILDAEIAKLLSAGRHRDPLRGPGGRRTSAGTSCATTPATFLALGQDVGRRLTVEGIEARGVTGALEFLREAGLGRPVTGRPPGAGDRRRQHRVGRGAQSRSGWAAARPSSSRWSPRTSCPSSPRTWSRPGTRGSPSRRTPRWSRSCRADGHVTGAVVCDARGWPRTPAAAVRPELIAGHRARGRLRHDPDRDRPGAAAGVAPRSPQRPRGHHRRRARPGRGQRVRRRRRACAARRWWWTRSATASGPPATSTGCSPRRNSARSRRSRSCRTRG